MEIVNGIILGIVQGLTEFLPISSSGHLIIMRDFLGIQSDNGLSFDAVLQLATTLAVLVYFWKDLWRIFMSFINLLLRKPIESKDKVMLTAIILGTIPAVFFGLLLEEKMETVFRNPKLVAGTLIFGALIMYFAEKWSKKDHQLTAKKGLHIGFYQAIALIPGMSRSGMTISGGLHVGLNREEATRFSFILAFPILLGSGLKKLLDLSSSGILDSVGSSLFAGSITAFFVGIFAIHFLIKYLKTHTLNAFVVYRIVLALLLILFL